MFRWFGRKKEDELLIYKLVREIRKNGCPMKARDLISWYALKYEEDVVRRELNKMAEVGIVIFETLNWHAGFGEEGSIEFVRLPEQSRDQIFLAS
jgi:hypothetical protein